MELIVISLSLTTLLAFIFLKSLFKRITTIAKLNPPPSPWRLPVLGNLHQLSLHPHRSFRSLSLRYGPLILLHFGRVPVLVVSSADVAHDVMKTHDLKFANRPKTKAVDIIMNGGRDVAFSSYGEYWRQMKRKKMVNEISGATQRFASTRYTCTLAGNGMLVPDQWGSMVSGVSSVSVKKTGRLTCLGRN